MTTRRTFLAAIGALPFIGKLARERVVRSSPYPMTLVFADGCVVFTSNTTIDTNGMIQTTIQAECDDSILYFHKAEIDRFFAVRNGMVRRRQSWCSDVFKRRTRFTLVDQEIEHAGHSQRRA